MRTNVLVDCLKIGSILACSFLAACSPKSEMAASNAPVVATEAAPANVTGNGVYALITASTPPADYDALIASVRKAPGIEDVLVLQMQAGTEPPGFQSLAVVEFKDEAGLNAWMSGEGSRSDPALSSYAKIKSHFP